MGVGEGIVVCVKERDICCVRRRMASINREGCKRTALVGFMARYLSSGCETRIYGSRRS